MKPLRPRPLLLEPLVINAGGAYSGRLVQDSRGLWWVHARMEAGDSEQAPYRTIFTEVEIPAGSDAEPVSRQIFQVDHLFPDRPAWDLEVDAEGGRHLLLHRHLGATRELVRVSESPPSLAELQAAPERGTPSLAHPSESFSHPRVERGVTPPEARSIVAVVDESRLVVFPPEASRYVELGEGLDGLLARSPESLRLIHRTALPSHPWREDNLAPGTLAGVELSSSWERVEEVQALPWVGEPSYGFDADLDEERLVCAAVTQDALRLAVSAATGPLEWEALYEARGGSPLASPSVLLDGEAAHVAVLEAAGEPSARVWYGWVDLTERAAVE